MSILDSLKQKRAKGYDVAHTAVFQDSCVIVGTFFREIRPNSSRNNLNFQELTKIIKELCKLFKNYAYMIIALETGTPNLVNETVLL